MILIPQRVSSADLARTAQLREDKHNIDNWTPDGLVTDIAEGAYYLVKNDEHHRRTYVIRGQEKA